MAPAAWDRSSQGGVKNRRPGVQKRKPRGLNFAPRGQISPPGEFQMGFWTPPGASWAPGRPVEDALGGKGGVGKLYGGLLGPSWGSFGASWARFGSGGSF